MIPHVRTGASHSQPASPHFDSDEKKSDDSSPDKTNQCDSEADPCDSTLVKIMAFLVDGNSAAYSAVYDRVNRNIDVDFNSLDCKVRALSAKNNMRNFRKSACLVSSYSDFCSRFFICGT